MSPGDASKLCPSPCDSGAEPCKSQYHRGTGTCLACIRREKQEYESLEGIIDHLSAQKQDTEKEMANLSGDYELMLELSQRLDKLTELIDGKTERWLELAEMEECAQA